MKIGTFAKNNHLSIDTIRHYMELGLLLPEKSGGQYDFSPREQAQLTLILDLKQCGFTLSEIKEIFYCSQFALVEQTVTRSYYEHLYESKAQQTEADILKLQTQLDHLKERLKQLKTAKPPTEKGPSGLPMKMLPLLACPLCQKDLILNEGQIVENRLVSGRLSCSCGKAYSVADGILADEALPSQSLYELKDYALKGQLYYDYLKETDQAYLKAFYEGAYWWNARMNPQDFQQKVILEIGSGIGFFLRNVYERLDEEAIYIAVDHNREAHLFLKEILSEASSSKNIVYLCCDMAEIPLRRGVVETMVDSSGSSNYYFDNETWLFSRISPLLKKGAKLYGSHIFFKKRVHYDPERAKYYKYFDEKEVLTQLKQPPFELLEETYSQDVACVKKDKYESYREIGDIVYFYMYMARWQTWG